MIGGVTEAIGVSMIRGVVEAEVFFFVEGGPPPEARSFLLQLVVCR